MSSSEIGNQQVPASSCEQQWDSIFEYNYTLSKSPVNSAAELSIDQVVPTASEPSDWRPNDDCDLNTLSLTPDLAVRSSYFDIDGLSLQNDSSPDELAPPGISEQQQQVATDARNNLDKPTLNATHTESPPTAEYYLSTEPINDDSAVPVYEVKKAKKPLRPCRVRIKEGKAPRHACHVEGCDKDFSRKDHLQRHLKTHFGAKLYACDWPSCEQRFTRKETLERHKKKHSDDTRFVCDICGKNFVRNDCLKLHHVRMHERAKLRNQWRERRGNKNGDDSCAVKQEATA